MRNFQSQAAERIIPNGSGLIDVLWQMGKAPFTANMKLNSRSDCDILILDPRLSLKLDIPLYLTECGAELGTMDTENPAENHTHKYRALRKYLYPSDFFIVFILDFMEITR